MKNGRKEVENTNEREKGRGGRRKEEWKRMRRKK